MQRLRRYQKSKATLLVLVVLASALSVSLFFREAHATLSLPTTGEIAYGTTQSAYMPWDLKETCVQKFVTLADTYGGTYESVGTADAAPEPWDIVLFKFGNPNGGKVMLDAHMHGNEFYGYETLYTLIHWLVTSSDSYATEILQKNYVLVVPVVNYRWGRTNYNDPAWMTTHDPSQDGDDCGVNLNRNFAPTWPSSLSTSNTDSYSGVSADSEAESQALINVWDTYAPRVYWNLHQGSGPYHSAAALTSQAISDRTAIASLYPTVCSALGVSPMSLSNAGTGNGYARDGARSRGIASYMSEIKTGWSNTASIRADLNSGTTYKQCKALFVAMCQAVESEESPPPDIVLQGYNSTLEFAATNFYAQVNSTVELDYGIFGCNVTGSWANESAVALSGLSAWINVTKTLTNADDVVQYRWWANDTDAHWGISSTYSLTVTAAPVEEPDKYFFDTDFYDADLRSFTSGLTYNLYNGSELLSYYLGDPSLLNGTYVLKTYYHSALLNSTTLQTATYGNSSVDIFLNLHNLSSVSGYVGTNSTGVEITVLSDTATNITFSLTTANPVALVVAVNKNASSVSLDDVTLTNWTYVDDSIQYNGSSLSTFKLIFPETTESETVKFIVTQPAYFPTSEGVYIYFPVPVNFTELYRLSNRWHFSTSVWITTTASIEIVEWFSSNWLNFTVSGAGTQLLSKGTKPEVVVLDDVSKSEGDGWSFSGTTITITGAASSVELYWGTTAGESGTAGCGDWWGNWWTIFWRVWIII